MLSRGLTLSALATVLMSTYAAANTCDELPSHEALTAALKENVAPTSETQNGGFELNMWATVVDRDGVVCAVTMTGEDRGDQWPGSRVISAQKANTANAFSLPGLALSTANLFSATQPGGSLYGLQHSNPVDAKAAYGEAEHYGTQRDPLVGKKAGGVNVFGGGLALYDEGGVLLGAVGVSGDSSCADHNIAWRVRKALDLENVPAGVSANKDDGILFDITNGQSTSGFGHPLCGGSEQSVAQEIGAGG